MWLQAFPAARRLRFTHHHPDGREPVEFDTRVMCLDAEGVARVVARLRADGLPAVLRYTARGVPWAVVPVRYVRYLVFEEPDTWSLATPNLRYLLTLHRDALARLTGAGEWGPEPETPAPPPPAPAIPSGAYEAYEA